MDYVQVFKTNLSTGLTHWHTQDAWHHDCHTLVLNDHQLLQLFTTSEPAGKYSVNDTRTTHILYDEVQSLLAYTGDDVSS